MEAIKLKIKNYRSVPLGSPIELELNEGITFILGMNNIGKSNVLRMLYEMRTVFLVCTGTQENTIHHMGFFFDELVNRRNRQQPRERIDDRRAVLLVFSSYNNEKSGPNFDFLQKVTDYHFHSGRNLDCYCAGYGLYEPEANNGMGTAIAFDKSAWPLTNFYPKLFHDIRSFIGKKLQHNWNYEGGIDLLLFPTGTPEKPIDWNRAAIVTSRSCVGNGKAFQDIDHLIRTVINLNEEFEDTIVPDQLDPEIARLKIKARAERMMGPALGGIFATAMKFVVVA